MVRWDGTFKMTYRQRSGFTRSQAFPACHVCHTLRFHPSNGFGGSFVLVVLSMLLYLHVAVQQALYHFLFYFVAIVLYIYHLLWKSISYMGGSLFLCCFGKMYESVWCMYAACEAYVIKAFTMLSDFVL